MQPANRFRIRTPDGSLSTDIFVTVIPQPTDIKPGCVLMIHEPTGGILSVHRSRLVPLDMPAPAAEPHPKSVCLKCGHVAGVVEDQVTCPYHEHRPCGLVEIDS